MGRVKTSSFLPPRISAPFMRFLIKLAVQNPILLRELWILYRRTYTSTGSTHLAERVTLDLFERIRDEVAKLPEYRPGTSVACPDDE